MKIILIILQITFPLILTENITFSKYKLHSNKLKYFHSFIYNNYSKNNAPIKQGFNYSIDIPKDNSNDEYSISKINIILSQSNFNIKSKLIDDLCIEGIDSLKNKSKLYNKILYFDEIELNKKKEKENENNKWKHFNEEFNNKCKHGLDIYRCELCNKVFPKEKLIKYYCSPSSTDISLGSSRRSTNVK